MPSETDLSYRRIYQDVVIATSGILHLIQIIHPGSSWDGNPLDLLAFLKALGEALTNTSLLEEFSPMFESATAHFNTTTSVINGSGPTRIRLYMQSLSTSVNIKEKFNPFVDRDDTYSQHLDNEFSSDIGTHLSEDGSQLIFQISVTVHHTLGVSLLFDGCDIWTSLGHQCFNLTSNTSSLTPHPTDIIAYNPPIDQPPNRTSINLPPSNLGHYPNHHNVIPTVEGVYINSDILTTFVFLANFPISNGRSVAILGVDFRTASFSSKELHVSVASRVLLPHSTEQQTAYQGISTLSQKSLSQKSLSQKSLSQMSQDEQVPSGYVSNGIGFIHRKLWPPFKPYSSDCFISRFITSTAGHSLGTCSTLTWPMSAYATETKCALAEAGVFGLPPACLFLSDAADPNISSDSQSLAEFGASKFEALTQLIGTLPPGAACSEVPFRRQRPNSNELNQCLVVPTGVGVLDVNLCHSVRK